MEEEEEESRNYRKMKRSNGNKNVYVRKAKVTHVSRLDFFTVFILVCEQIGNGPGRVHA